MQRRLRRGGWHFTAHRIVIGNPEAWSRARPAASVAGAAERLATTAGREPGIPSQQEG